MNRRWWRGGALAASAAALLLTACLPKGVRVPQNEFLAVVERKSGLVAYQGADGNIYTVDQGGSKPTPVTTDADLKGDYLVYDIPVWAPDSRSVAFVGYQGKAQQAPDSISLFVADKDGKNLTQAYSSTTDVIYYYWSPDSRRLSFISPAPGSNLALKVVSPSGGEAETLDVGNPFYWAWAPNSQSVLIHAGAAPSRLSILQIADTVVEQGLEITPTTFKAPAYSPEGSRMLVAGETADGKPALLLADAAGGHLRPVAEYTGNIAFAWSPDGKRIAYIASDHPKVGQEGKLTIVDPAGKQKPVELKDDLAQAFFWSPDSAWLAYFSTEIVAAPTPESSGDSASGDQTVRWHLNVMDTKSGDARPVTTLQPTESFLRVLPYFDQYHQSVTIWSPDSRNLVLSAYVVNGQADMVNGAPVPGIWVVAASGNLEARFIAPGLVGFWSWK